MEDKAFFERVLGLGTEWAVKDIHVDMEGEKVSVETESNISGSMAK